mmetsp:Transcript_11688/g.21915  ORF Transcript_11688/g.21915 Transcript_11688/m.21915 type:complete len:699 (-) Transcript_11688:203-2299(-)
MLEPLLALCQFLSLHQFWIHVLVLLKRLADHVQPLHAEPPGLVEVRLGVPSNVFLHLLQETGGVDRIRILEFLRASQNVVSIVQQENVREGLCVLLQELLLHLVRILAKGGMNGLPVKGGHSLDFYLQVLEQGAQQLYNNLRHDHLVLRRRHALLGLSAQHFARVGKLLQSPAVLDEVGGQGMYRAVLRHAALAGTAVVRRRVHVHENLDPLGRRPFHTTATFLRTLGAPARIAFRLADGIPLHGIRELSVRVSHRVDHKIVHLKCPLCQLLRLHAARVTSKHALCQGLLLIPCVEHVEQSEDLLGRFPRLGDSRGVTDDRVEMALQDQCKRGVRILLVHEYLPRKVSLVIDLRERVLHVVDPDSRMPLDVLPVHVLQLLGRALQQPLQRILLTLQHIDRLKVEVVGKVSQHHLPNFLLQGRGSHVCVRAEDTVGRVRGVDVQDRFRQHVYQPELLLPPLHQIRDLPAASRPVGTRGRVRILLLVSVPPVPDGVLSQLHRRDEVGLLGLRDDRLLNLGDEHEPVAEFDLAVRDSHEKRVPRPRPFPHSSRRVDSAKVFIKKLHALFQLLNGKQVFSELVQVVVLPLQLSHSIVLQIILNHLNSGTSRQALVNIPLELSRSFHLLDCLSRLPQRSLHVGQSTAQVVRSLLHWPKCVVEVFRQVREVMKGEDRVTLELAHLVQLRSKQQALAAHLLEVRA